VDIDDSLVDTHFKSVPSLGTLTARTLTGGDLEDLSWDADWPFSFVALVLGSSNNFSASSFEWLSLLASKSHSIYESYDKYGT